MHKDILKQIRIIPVNWTNRDVDDSSANLRMTLTAGNTNENVGGATQNRN